MAVKVGMRPRLLAYLLVAQRREGRYVSSRELSKAVGGNDAVARRDLEAAEVVGTRGFGYERVPLIARLSALMSQGVVFEGGAVLLFEARRREVQGAVSGDRLDVYGALATGDLVLAGALLAAELEQGAVADA